MANLSDSTGTIHSEVDATHKALRTAVRPQEALGHYLFGGFTGILPAALAANSEIFQFRNPSPNPIAIRRIRVSSAVSTTFFAAGVPLQMDLIRSITWSAQGTGGTAIAPAALMRARTSMANSSLTSGDMRIATTAALGAGTKTLDTYPLAALVAAGPITASLNGGIIPPDTALYESEVGDGDHPLILAQFQGFSIRSVAVPATGTWTAGISIKWQELDSY